MCKLKDYEESGLAPNQLEEIRNKAIEELCNKIIMHLADWQLSEDDKWVKDIIELASESVEEIAEEMKGEV